MVLVLTHEDVKGLVTLADAIDMTAKIVQEEVAGTTVHMAPFGGQHARPRGLPPAHSGDGFAGVLRVVGGGAYGIGRIGVRAGGAVMLFDTSGNDLIALLPSIASNMRISANVGLGARYLARPESRSIAMLGSGRLALPTLEGLCAVRQIERISVFSPSVEHRTSFARKASDALGIPVAAVDSTEAATADADIIAVATAATTPALRANHLRPGVHVTSVGEPHELDESVFLRADQVVVTSLHLEMATIDPSGQRALQRKGLAPAPLWNLLADGRIPRESLIELGSLVNGDVTPKNGPTDVTILHEAQGGVGDIALASLAYQRAKELGRGKEIAL